VKVLAVDAMEPTILSSLPTAAFASPSLVAGLL
jgi:hypothetical protein